MDKITRSAMLKGSFAVLGGAALAPWLAACGGEENNAQAGLDPNEEVTVDYWVGVTGATVDVFRDLFDDFQKKNPNVTVNIKTYPEYGELTQALQAAVAGNNAPAMVGLGYSNLRYAAELIPHVNITDLPGFDAAWLQGNFAPNILGLGQVDGAQHVQPYLLGTPYLFYNADVFERAGVDRPPQTWPELREAARRLSEEIGRPSFTVPEVGYYWAYQSMIESNGARMLTGSEGNYRTEVASPEALEGIQLMADMILEDETAVLINEEQAGQNFTSGQLPMMTGFGQQVRTAQQESDFRVASAPLPSWEGKEKRVPIAGNGFFVPEGTEPQQQAAVWELIRYLNDPESLTTWSEGSGYPPARRGLTDDPRYLKPFFAENRLLQPEVEQLSSAVPWLSFPGESGPQALEALVDARDRVITDGQDAASTMREAAGQVEEMLNS